MWRGPAFAMAIAGALLGLLEAVVVALCDGALFLSVTEWGRYALAAVSGLAVATMVVGLGVYALDEALRGKRTLRRQLPQWLGALCAPGLAWALWVLTEGRRVRDMPLRPLVVAVVALMGGAAVAWLTTVLLHHLRSRRGLRVSTALYGVAVVLMVLDSQVLRRLYEAFHMLLALMTFGAVLLAGRGLVRWVRPRVRISMWWLALLVPLAAALWFSMARATNMRFAVESAAPLTGKMLACWSSLSAHVDDADPELDVLSRTPGQAHAGVDLSGRDVLLLTVDALRADRLAAYGGRGLTPEMDALVAQGAYIERAYTTTPHTSYAMASLMAGKYMREIVSLSDDQGDHVTLADTFRRYGYRTAGFYPPALFYVDEDRFAALRDKQFGFEYVKVMFAPAADRVTQVAQYLEHVEPGHPVLVWVHFFEPHEPYDPAPEFLRGSSPQQRYDGEVAQTDAAIGDLVRLFLKLRGDNAVVVLTADHGEEFQDHGGALHGTTLFDEQVHVPLVFVARDAIAHARISVAVDHTAVVSTLLSAFGMPRDIRMRGADLGAVLAGEDADPQLRAFASVGDERMIVDGRRKLICRKARGCRLFDLIQDPRERRDVSLEASKAAQQLRGELATFEGSIASHEILGLGGAAFPEALSRARLGDPTVGAELVPLLGDERSEIRAEAALACAHVRHAPARPILSRLRSGDAAPAVRSAAAVAAWLLGDEDAEGQVLGLLDDGGVDRKLRFEVALALGAKGRKEAVDELERLAMDSSAEEESRVRAVTLLGQLAQHESLPTLVRLLPELRLRAPVAEALGRIGGKEASAALVEALRDERYPNSRAAEAKALASLRSRELAPLLVRFLGTETSLPGGLSLLASLGKINQGAVRGGSLSSLSRLRRGAFSCGELGCIAGEGAALQLGSLVASMRGTRRLVATVHSEQGGLLQLGDHDFDVAPGDGQISVLLAAGAIDEPLVVKGREVAIDLVALVPATEDLPPPAPQPWDAGVPTE